MTEMLNSATYRWCGLACAASLLASGFATADVITVNQDGSGDHTAIQAAINASSDGDEIEVYPGTYDTSSQLTFAGRSIEIRGATTAEEVILDAGGYRCMNAYTNGDAVVLRNLSFIAGADTGGVIYITNDASVHVFDCIFTDLNPSDNPSYAGAVYVGSGQFEATNCTFTDFVTGGDGGAIRSSTDNSVRLTDCTFENCSTNGGGGAIYAYGSTPLIMTGCTFSNCSARYEAGAVQLGTSSSIVNVFTDCTFESNTLDYDTNNSQRGGAIYTSNSVNLTLDSCTFRGNSVKQKGSNFNSSDRGGAIYFENPNSVTITDCVFEDNEAWRGGVIFCNQGYGIAYSGTSFEGNQAHDWGGAIEVYYVETTPTTFDGCSFTNNSASSNSSGSYGGGAIHAYNSEGLSFTNTTFTGNSFTLLSNNNFRGGGAIYSYQTPITLDGCTFTDNEYIEGLPVSNSDSENGGGAIYIYNDTFSATDTIFEGNSTRTSNRGQGGAVYQYDGYQQEYAGCTFSNNAVTFDGTNNNAVGSGGAIRLTGLGINATNCVFSGNTVTGPTVEYVSSLEGGALRFNGTSTFDTCAFDSNTASYAGGAVYAAGNTSMTNCTVTGNASHYDGAVYGSNITISGSTFCDNAPRNTYGSVNDDGSNTMLGHCKGSSTVVQVPEQYATIREAIWHALDGDTIEVGPGTYTLNLNYDSRALSLVGTAGAENTIIDLGESANHCIEIGNPAGPSLVEGFTLRNAQSPSNESGTGIFGEGGETLTVRDCILEDLNCTIYSSSYRGGAGIYWDGDLEVDNTAFLRCRITHVDGNSSDYELIGGGAIKALNGTLSVSGCIFEECEYSYDQSSYDDSNSGGGAIHATNTTFTLTDTTFTSCSALGRQSGNHSSTIKRGGAIYLAGSLADIENATFASCSSHEAGGAIYTDSDLVVANSDFSSCQTENNSGGAIYSEAVVNLNTNTFTSNSAYASGGAVVASQGCTSSTCTFSENSAGAFGGGLYASSTLACTDTVFELNAADSGGGAYLAAAFTFSNCTFLQNAATNSGGGLYVYFSTGSLDTCAFTGNSSNDGGGFYSYDSTDITLLDITFLGNSATNDGGGVYADSSYLSLTSCTIEGNSAIDDGGGMMTKDGGLLINQLTCQGNDAGEDGGGLKSYRDTEPVILESSFLNNSATLLGGGVDFWNVLGENGARMANCEVLGNSTDGAGGGIRIGNLDTKVTLVDCVVGENTAEVGGGINSFDARQVTLQNVAVYNNHASLFGGGIYDEGYGGGLQETVINESTISGNTAGSVGGGIYLLLREMAISNTDFCGNDPGQIIGFWSDYGGNTFSETTCFFDCNANGIEDSIEIAEGGLSDCDGNSIPDICEIADGSAEDCDGDGVPDVCAKGGFVTFTSGTLPAAGTGVPQSLVIPMAQASASSVTVTVEAIGDLSSPYEYLVLELNSTKIGTLFTSGTDCSSHPAHDTAHIDAVVFNSAAGSGQVTITVLGSVAVDPNFCSNGMTRITVSYTAALNGDCNENGVLDACEIANGDEDDANGNGIPDSCEPCIGDFDGDDVVSGGDLGFLLGLFNTASTEADLNGDGYVDAADLGLLLSAWGPC